MTITAEILLTAAEFGCLPEPPDGSKEELVRGVVVTTPAPGFMEGYVAGRVGTIMNQWVPRVMLTAERRGLDHCREDGFTVVEVMVATSILLIVLALLFSTLVSLTNSENRAERLVANEQNVRFELDQLAIYRVRSFDRNRVAPRNPRALTELSGAGYQRALT